MKKITMLQAVKVVLQDRLGIICAIDMLEEMGFDTHLYQSFLDAFSQKELEEDFDSINIKARDFLYNELGIYDSIQEAYNIVELIEEEVK